MKENKITITVLNSLLADEIIALNRSILISENCENSGYFKLLMAARKQAIDDMARVECLIKHSIFSNCTSSVTKPNTINIGVTDTEMINNSNGHKPAADYTYNRANNNFGEVDNQETIDQWSGIENDFNSQVEIQHDQIVQKEKENSIINQTGSD